MISPYSALLRLLTAPAALVILALLGTDAGAVTYSVLHAFGPTPDGVAPQGNLINVGGILYGTTAYGGISNDGTVFSITTSGIENVVYAFSGSNDAERPLAGLVNLNGTLYGTSPIGTSPKASGTVFSVSADGKEQLVYRFQGAKRGNYPSAPLLNVNGRLYGTTYVGGSTSCGGGGCGTVFMVTPQGTHKVLHSFVGGGDGAYPTGGLIYYKGKLYGTTNSGGINCGAAGCGTVFSVSLKGEESIVYYFVGAGFSNTDGSYPESGLLNVGGTFYGTTLNGGTQNSGTVFSVTPAGLESVVFSFTGSSTGFGPYSGLVRLDGKLYGTTYDGGKYGFGTVYSVTPNGVEKVLVSFAGGLDGENPTSGLIDVNGTLYGITPAGGSTGCPDPEHSQSGCGTVYAVSPK